MDEKVKAERRKIMAEAVKGAKKALGIDLAELSRVQTEFDKKYDKLQPQIARQYVKGAEVISKKHNKVLAARYAAAKKGILADKLTTIFPSCWCDFLEDFLEASVCDHSIPIQDVDAAGNLEIDFECIHDENKAKPFVVLKGGGDGVTNSVELVSRIAFNINDSMLSTKTKYCLIPTVLLNGYWLKENWAGCEGVASSGDFSLTLKIRASQLGGTKLLGEVETTVFDWSSSDGYTNAIDATFNLSASSTSRKLALYPEIDPADGDVFVEIELAIFMSMTGYGRFLVDMKNSNAFYFWVERLELAKHICLPIHCKIGGPETLCRIGGPDSVLCVVGGPNSDIYCKSGGPDSGVLCSAGGPIIPGPICKSGPDLGCPAGPAIGCLAGPPLEVIPDPELWEKGIVTVDLEKVPSTMKRPVAKMLSAIKKGL